MPLILLAIPTFLALFFAIIWLSYRHPFRHKTINRSLLIQLAIIAYTILVIYGHLNVIPLIHHLTDRLTYTDATLFFLIMPLFYTLLLYVIEERPLLSFKNAKHSWPAFPGLLYSINYSIKPEALQEQIVDGKACGIFPDSLLYLIGTISFVLYIIICITLLIKTIHQKAPILQAHSLRQLYFYVWILYGFLFLTICYGILTQIAPSSFEIHDTIISILILVSIFYLTIIFFIKPEPIQLINNDNPGLTNISTPVIENEKKEEFEIVIQKLDHLLKEKNIFLNPELDLETLSQISKIPGYKISASIHDQCDISVPEYLNQYRVSYAKKCLLDTNMSAIKIDFFAQECGFSSRSNFYSTFKKHTGLTPTEFKKQSFEKIQTKNSATKSSIS